MKLLVSVERRYKFFNNEYYVQGIEDTAFFERYLSEFESVTILARVERVDSKPVGYVQINNKKVNFTPIFTKGYGIFDFFLFKKVIDKYKSHEFLLRTPGILSYTFSLYCILFRKSFSCEVVTNPKQEAVNSTNNYYVNNILAVIFPFIFKLQLKKCKFSSFVTKKQIQASYLSDIEILSPKFNSSYSSLALRDEFFIDTPNYRLISKDTDVFLLFVGVLDKNFKGLDVFINIIKELPFNYKGIVVGSGLLLDDYISYAFELNLSERIIFKGYISSEIEKKKIYMMSDIFVLSSRREGLPRVVIEAMSNALPCICSNVSGVSELVDQKYIFEQENVLQAKELILNLKTEELRCMSLINYNESLRYSEQKLSIERDNFYRKIKGTKC